MKNGQGRVQYFDVLRICACVAVVLLHVAATNQKTSYSDGNVFAWDVFNCYVSSARWSLPVFLMISGALFLTSEKPLRAIVKENVLRLAVAYVFWATVYSLQGILFYGWTFKNFIYGCVFGHYHLWYIPMLIGLYLIVPFLRPIARDKHLADYFLILAVIFNYALPQFIGVLEQLAPRLSASADVLLGGLQLKFVLGYSAYYVLGYRIFHSDKYVPMSLAVLLFVCSVFITAAGTRMLMQCAGEHIHLTREALSLNVLLEAISVFVFAKNIGSTGKTLCQHRMIQSLAKVTFGVYLVHPLVIETLNQISGLNAMLANPIVSVPLVTLIVTGISFFISYGMSRIPIIKDWVV